MDHKSKGSAAVLGGISPMAARMGSRDDQANVEDVNSSVRAAETIMRLLPIALCVSALVVMLKNSESNDFGSLSYSDLGALRYLVHANGICAGYSLLSAVIVAMRRPFTQPQAWTFFILDQVLTYLILGAGATSTEVLYLANKGDTSITWSAACVSFGGFCHKGLISVVITFVVIVCYAGLSLLSSYKLFTRYDAPVVSYHGKAIQIPSFQPQA